MLHVKSRLFSLEETDLTYEGIETFHLLIKFTVITSKKPTWLTKGLRLNCNLEFTCSSGSLEETDLTYEGIETWPSSLDISDDPTWRNRPDLRRDWDSGLPNPKIKNSFEETDLTYEGIETLIIFLINDDL